MEPVKNMSEADFQDWVVRIAKMCNWSVHHVSPHQVRPGVFRSDTPGWPDLTLVRKNELIFAELKTDAGRVSDHQKHWLNLLTEVAETYVWRPMNMVSIAARLNTTEIFPSMKALRWA